MKNKISADEIAHLASLSGLELAESEMAEFEPEISQIIDSFDRLKALDTSGVEPTFQVNDLVNVWRDDVIEVSSVSREQLLALAPEQQDNSVKVPKVL